MQVSITQALRIQKQVAESIMKLMQEERCCKYGVLTEDDVTIETGDANAKTFPVYMYELQRLFNISEKLNSILAGISVRDGISDKVRVRENFKVLQRIYENSITRIPVLSSTRWEVVGDKKTQVVRKFSPFMSKKELKAKIKEFKGNIRELQDEIDSLNMQMVELPFEYSDIDSLDSED